MQGVSKELYNGIPNVTAVWRVLQKRLDTLCNIRGWIICTPLSVNVFVTLATELHLEYYCKTLFETPCITSRSHIEP
jgi:hypothetical protein